MKGAIIANRYYNDYGMDYIFRRLKEEFTLKHIDCNVVRPIFYYDNIGNYKLDFEYDFAVFWDKDIKLAKALESMGVKVFNSCFAIDTCDDKEKTIAQLHGYGIQIPITIPNPLEFDINDNIDEEFITQLERQLNYPLVIKENTGSQGRQVYLAHNRQELLDYRKKLLHIPHLYQQLIDINLGNDIRIYTIGGKAKAFCKRHSTTDFKSNVFQGGKILECTPNRKFIETAEKISELLKLDYAAIDFFDTEEPILLEVNSNAYFKGIETVCNQNIAKLYIEHIIEVMKCCHKI